VRDVSNHPDHDAKVPGLGSVWTTLHLSDEKAVAELLGIPDHVTQAALFPGRPHRRNRPRTGEAATL